jgi:hypothetical protein
MGPSCPVGRSVGTSVSEGLGASILRGEVVCCVYALNMRALDCIKTLVLPFKSRFEVSSN